MVNLPASIGLESARTLVRVLDVRSQNRFGVIFRGQRITAGGELLNTHNELIVKARYCDLAVPVMLGQWWDVTGMIARRSAINHLGFEMTEDLMEVAPGGV